ncbi:MAG: hypothetical protein JSS87_03420 [Acidobacteria bacterium]|nr:hypothetical protein [Acidobacteriota bacterium]
MRTMLAIAALLLLQTQDNSLLRIAHFRSMREVHVKATKGRLACAVLPPALFHEAAAALRDLRLTENGQEIPFAQEESYDENSLASGVTSPSDRSYFDVVAEKETAPGNGNQVANFHLPARIPVERISLGRPATHDLSVRVTARISSNPQLAENISGTIHAGESSFPVTIGANLQSDADVEVTLQQSTSPLHVRLEMRRRWICFEPLKSTSDLRLHYGDATLPAANYRFAATLIMPENPELATLGPRTEEPQLPLEASARHSWRKPLLVSLGFVILLLPLIAIALYTKKLRPH